MELFCKKKDTKQPELVLTRSPGGSKQTVGLLTLTRGGKVLFGCFTLELPYLDNASNISSIPTGIYKAGKYSPYEGREVILLSGVPGRTYIEVHSGNYNTDTHGCILVGSGLADINGDGYADVTGSQAALTQLYSLLDDEFLIEIR